MKIKRASLFQSPFLRPPVKLSLIFFTPLPAPVWGGAFCGEHTTRLERALHITGLCACLQLVKLRGYAKCFRVSQEEMWMWGQDIFHVMSFKSPRMQHRFILPPCLSVLSVKTDQPITVYLGSICLKG